MEMKSIVNGKKGGFTLIEMIGVIAIIGILAAFITPKVFQVIEDSKVTRFAGEFPAYPTAITKWYSDIGSLQSLVAAGTLSGTDTSFDAELITNLGTTPTTGLWAKWKGPYLDSVKNISLGTALTIETNAGTAGTAACATASSTAFDLNDDDKNDMDSKQVVALKLTGILSGEFDKVDAILDKGLTTGAQNTRSGRVKYDSGTTTLYIYVTAL